jgi:hypothetical protein
MTQQQHKKRLSGDRNQCPTCGEYFNSTFAFDKHRQGKHGIDRHCLKIEQMLAIGMDKNAHGFWISAKNPQQEGYTAQEGA